MSKDELAHALESERKRRIAAENDAVLQNLQTELLKQDINMIRRIIEKGGSAQDVLNFLDTPNTN